MSIRKIKNQGMNWIRKEKRLALYMLYGMQCSYCEGTAEEVDRLTLDHLTPVELGGSNHETNLACSCVTCNSRRGLIDWKDFARIVAEERQGVTAEEIIERIETLRFADIDVNQAKGIIKAAGNWPSALSMAARMVA